MSKILKKIASLVEDYREWEGPISDAELYRAVRQAMEMRGEGQEIQRWGSAPLPIPIPFVGIPIQLSIMGANKAAMELKLRKLYKDLEDQNAIRDLSQQAYEEAYETPRIAKWFGWPGLIVNLLTQPDSPKKRAVLKQIMTDYKKDLEDLDKKHESDSSEAK